MVPENFETSGRWHHLEGNIISTHIDIEREKSRLRALATAKIAPLQDAVDLDMATMEELKAWRKFRVEVNRLDSSVEGATLPTPPDRD